MIRSDESISFWITLDNALSVRYNVQLDLIGLIKTFDSKRRTHFVRTMLQKFSLHKSRFLSLTEFEVNDILTVAINKF